MTTAKMAGSRKKIAAFRWLGLTAMLLSPGFACGDSEDDNAETDSTGSDEASSEELIESAESGELEFSEENTLLSLAADCVLAGYSDFVDRAEALSESTDALTDDPTDDALSEAQASWEDAMLAWQRLELFQFGPSADTSIDTPGAADMRDAIYSWTNSSACRVDQATLGELYEDGGYEVVLAYRGLDALEHLLFADYDDGAASACAETNQIVSDGSWDEFATSGDLLQRRATYASILSQDVLQSARALEDAWLDGFVVDFVSGSGEYESRQEVLNSIYGGMFYFDTIVKDIKMALLEATGCAEDQAECVRVNLEHSAAGISKPAVEANLQNFRDLLVGCGENELGFDDLLADIDEDELSDSLLELTDTAIESVDALDDDDLSTAAADDEAGFVDAWTDVQAMVTLFKTEFAAALSLELPAGGPGDND